jgi:hypothetical protein
MAAMTLAGSFRISAPVVIMGLALALPFFLDLGGIAVSSSLTELLPHDLPFKLPLSILNSASKSGLRFQKGARSFTKLLQPVSNMWSQMSTSTMEVVRCEYVKYLRT